jgi:WD40 repeat protein
VLRVAWRPDGAIVASASADMLVRLWDVRAAKAIIALGGHTDWFFLTIGAEWLMVFRARARAERACGAGATRILPDHTSGV